MDKASAESGVRVGGGRWTTQTRRSPVRSSEPTSAIVVSLVSELQQKIDILVRDRDALRSCPPSKSSQGLSQVDGAGSSLCGEHSTDAHQRAGGWISDRNCEFRNAMEFGVSSLMAKIGLFCWARGNTTRFNEPRSPHGRSTESE